MKRWLPMALMVLAPLGAFAADGVRPLRIEFCHFAIALGYLLQSPRLASSKLPPNHLGSKSTSSRRTTTTSLPASLYKKRFPPSGGQMVSSA